MTLPPDPPPLPAPEAPPPPEPAPRPDPDQAWRGLEVLKDNIEAFTIALVLALLIKHFCVEAFKIPTGSMMPTLYGERNSPNGIGDRILVDKWAYLAHGPERWDVVVFRYPLNQSKHFIKRVAGVGPEWLNVVDGDLWSRASEDGPWRIPEKRRRVRDELYLPVYPPEEQGEEGRWGSGEIPAPGEWWACAGGWTAPRHGALAFAGGERAAATFQKRIGRSSSPQSWGMSADGALVRDARFRLRVRPGGATTLRLSWRTRADAAVTLTLAPPGVGPSGLASARGERTRAANVAPALLPGRWTEVELECVDGRAYAHLDGQEVAATDDEVTLGEVRALGDFEQRFTIEAEGGALEVEGLRVDRDLYYVPDDDPRLGADRSGEWVPADHLFMLGDNTEGSSDSRKWKLAAVRLADGREILYESQDSENAPRTGPDGITRVVDREGVERRWSVADEDPSGRTRDLRREPFVPRDLVVGRAFYVFWPLLPGFPGRAGFIH